MATTESAAENGVECPTCDRDDFDDKRSMRTHHTLAHGESLVNEPRDCEQCGERFEPRSDATGRFCSVECHQEHQRRDLAEFECQQCGVTFKATASDDRKYCSHDCASEAARKQVSRDCAECGRTFKTQLAREVIYCCRQCESEARVTRPRPRNGPMLMWLLYVYEGHNLSQTYRRQRAVFGHGDCFTQSEVSDILENLGVKAANQGQTAMYEATLERMDPDDIGAATPDGDDGWQRYAQPGGDD